MVLPRERCRFHWQLKQRRGKAVRLDSREQREWYPHESHLPSNNAAQRWWARKFWRVVTCLKTHLFITLIAESPNYVHWLIPVPKQSEEKTNPTITQNTRRVMIKINTPGLKSLGFVLIWFQTTPRLRDTSEKYDDKNLQYCDTLHYRYNMLFIDIVSFFFYLFKFFFLNLS